MFFVVPLGHSHGLVRRMPWVTIAIIVACVAVHIASLATGGRPIELAGYRPVDGGMLRMVTAAFVHGGVVHLLGNMLFLYLTGCNLEDRWTRGLFLIFYLCAAVVASFTYGVWHPNSTTLLIGASGAVSALLGAFLVVYGAAAIRFFYVATIFVRIFTGTFELPAYVALPIWFAIQVVSVVFESDAGGVAYSAHIGGFVFGVVVGATLRATGLDRTLEAKGDEVVFERNPQVAAWASRAENQPLAAFVAFREALEKQPCDPEARALLLRVLAKAPMSARLVAEVERLLYDESRRAGGAYMVEVHRTLLGRGDQATDLLSDGVLLLVGQAAAQLGEPELAISALGGLIRQHPQSARVPRALWDAAEIQARGGRSDLAQGTLRTLVNRFPADPFAQRAHERLASLQRHPTPTEGFVPTSRRGDKLDDDIIELLPDEILERMRARNGVRDTWEATGTAHPSTIVGSPAPPKHLARSPKPRWLLPTALGLCAIGLAFAAYERLQWFGRTPLEHHAVALGADALVTDESALQSIATACVQPAGAPIEVELSGTPGTYALYVQYDRTAAPSDLDKSALQRELGSLAKCMFLGGATRGLQRVQLDPKLPELHLTEAGHGLRAELDLTALRSVDGWDEPRFLAPEALDDAIARRLTVRAVTPHALP